MQRQNSIPPSARLLLVMLAATPTFTGCASFVSSGNDAASNCAGWRFIDSEPEDDEVISATLAEGLRVHNDRFVERCEP